MKTFRVSDIRWATTDELALPFWEKWNKKRRLPKNFWQRIWEYPYLALKVPRQGRSLDFGGTYPFILFEEFPEAQSVDIRNLNELDHDLHRGLWPKEKLIVSDAANVPVEDNAYDFTFSISAIEEMPHMMEVLKEMVRVGRHRVVVTMDVSDNLGVSICRLRELEEYLGVAIPPIPFNALTSMSREMRRFWQKRNYAYKDIRVLAFTLDSMDPAGVGILIPHWNSLSFLKICLDRLRLNTNQEFEHKVYVLDDCSDDGSFEEAQKLYRGCEDIEFHRIERWNKNSEADVGLLLDEGLKLVNEQFVLMMDADLFALNRDWLCFPKYLLEKYNCISVGLDTGLSTYYARKTDWQTWWQPETGYLPHSGLYDNSWFSCTNNLYRLMSRADARVVAEQIGFTRASSKSVFRSKLKREIDFYISEKLQKIRYKSLNLMYQKYLGSYGMLFNRRFPYIPGGADNGVAANHFMDVNRMGPKFNIPITSFVGFTPKDGVFGQNIAGFAFHFALSTRALSETRREVQDAGDEFNKWVKEINKCRGVSEALIDAMVKASEVYKAGGSNGEISEGWYLAQNDIIQALHRDYVLNRNRKSALMEV